MTLNLAIAWANLLGAAVAAVLQFCATRRGAMHVRWWHAMTASMGLVYIVGYIWLLFDLDDPRQWSQVMRGVAVVAWVAVWWAPALLSLHMRRKEIAATEAAAKALEHLGER